MTYTNTLTDLVRMTGEMNKISAAQVLSPERTREFVRPRQELMAALYRSKRMTYPAIGAAFGFDHSTVQHAHKRITALEKESPSVKARVDELTKAAEAECREIRFRFSAPTFRSVRAAK